MFSWLTARWQQLRKARHRRQELAPRSFRHMAREIGELAELASRLGPQDEAFQTSLRALRDEMDHLGRLTGLPEFRRLSLEKRQELRDSLVHSRGKLLETVRSAPPASDRLQ